MSEFRRRLMMAQSGGGGDKYKYIEPTIIKNVYITSRGIESAYNGWDATDYIDLEGYRYAIFHTDTYQAFYDSNKQFLVNRADANDGLSTIPQGAKYVRYSGSAGQMAKNPCLLFNESIEPTTLTDIEYTNSYVNPDTAIITPYNNWNVFKVSTSDYYGAFFNRNQSSGSYDTSDNVLSHGYYFYTDADYVRFSLNANSIQIYLLPK